MELLRELITEYNLETIPLMEVISQAVRELKLMKKGGKVSNKMVKDFMKSNQKLTVAAAFNAIASYKPYKTNRRNIISLYAKSAYSKKLIRKVVDAMIDSKLFKIHRERYSEGGKFYELKQIKSGF